MVIYLSYLFYLFIYLFIYLLTYLFIYLSITLFPTLLLALIFVLEVNIHPILGFVCVIITFSLLQSFSLTCIYFPLKPSQTLYFLLVLILAYLPIFLQCYFSLNYPFISFYPFFFYYFFRSSFPAFPSPTWFNHHRLSFHWFSQAAPS